MPSGLKRREKEEARMRKTMRSTPVLQFKRAEHFLREAKLRKRDSIRVHRNLRKFVNQNDIKSMVPKEGLKLICVVRIRTANGIG